MKSTSTHATNAREVLVVGGLARCSPMLFFRQWRPVPTHLEGLFRATNLSTMYELGQARPE